MALLAPHRSHLNRFVNYTFERMSLAAHMDILGSRLTEQLEDRVRLPKAYLDFRKLGCVDPNKRSCPTTNQPISVYQEDSMDFSRWHCSMGHALSREESSLDNQSNLGLKTSIRAGQKRKPTRIKLARRLPQGTVRIIYFRPFFKEESNPGALVLDYEIRSLLNDLLAPLSEETNPFPSK